MADPTRERYVEATGSEPTDPPDEFRWQWTYRGRPEERELLLDLLQEEAEQAVQQETLF